MPIIVRPAGNLFEIVAGARRFGAAKIAGLKEIPADVRNLSDDEAREIQIIENLQRADVHPLDEGGAYRDLIEKQGRTVNDVALKVGKSETYVRGRLFLTNLEPSVAKLYRQGELSDSVAVVVASISPSDQKRFVDYFDDHALDVPTAKRWIQENIDKPLDNQPWVRDAAIAKIVGPCKECPPNRASLFGDLKPGQCTDLKCWGRKMANYINYLAKENPKLVMVTRSYSRTDELGKNILNQSDYTLVAKRGKDRCENIEPAVIVAGSEAGNLIDICRTGTCEKHGNNRSSSTPYKRSAKEMAAAKKQREADKKSEEKAQAFILATLKKVKWPMTADTLDFILAQMFEHYSTMVYRPIAKRHAWEEVKGEPYSKGDKPRTDWQLTVQTAVKAMDTDSAKLQLLIELFLEKETGQYRGVQGVAEALKKL